jgi:RNA polymerase sigma-B factor
MSSTERLWAYHQTKLKGGSPESLIRLRNQIALANDKLAISVARHMSGKCDLAVEDLIQLARIGLLKAIERFDPTSGVALSSFAVPYCEGEIKHYLRDHKSLLKVPRRWQEKSDEVRNLQLKVANSGRVVTVDEVATVGLGLPNHKWQAIAHATAHKPLTSLDEDEALQVASEEDLPLEERERREAIQEVLMERLGKLSPHIKRCIVEKFWGELSEDVIAKRQGFSTAKVRALIAEGLRQLGEVA